MIKHSRLHIDPASGKACFGSYDVPLEIDEEVTSIIENTHVGAPKTSASMLRRAKNIANQFPTFLCAQYALASVLLNNSNPSISATLALDRAWTIGVTEIMTHKVLDVHYSASQGNASFIMQGQTL